MATLMAALYRLSPFSSPFHPETYVVILFVLQQVTSLEMRGVMGQLEIPRMI
jgi:hypothetical protein